MERCGGASPTYTHTHPFIHEVKMTTAQKIQSTILGCVLFPIRITLTTLLFLLMWPIARLRLAGLSQEERAKPVRGWRKWFIHPIIAFLSRSVFFAMGFFWIKVKGRQAMQEEAPVLAVAPHSGFLDMLILSVAGLPTVVSRSENSNLPVIGALLEFNQSVLVSRKDPESRKKCVTQIKERLTSNGYWPQMLMFPEGTTTNGRVLIKFKPGAFLAGVPVQPVLLHYSNTIDTVRWTWKGASWLDCLWYTAAQLYSNITVEFLPVYTPSQEEKQNPDLFADNVQKLMAKILGVPATDYVMEGRYPVTKLGGLSLPLESPSQETLKMLKQQDFSNAQVETLLNTMIDRCHSGLVTIAVDHLTSMLGLADRQAAAKICSLYSKSDTLDLRQLCLSLCMAAGLGTPESLLHTAFLLYNSNGDGLLNAEDLSGLMAALVGVPQYNIEEMYSGLTNQGQPTEGEYRKRDHSINLIVVQANSFKNGFDFYVKYFMFQFTCTLWNLQNCQPAYDFPDECGWTTCGAGVGGSHRLDLLDYINCSNFLIPGRGTRTTISSTTPPPPHLPQHFLSSTYRHNPEFLRERRRNRRWWGCIIASITEIIYTSIMSISPHSLSFSRHYPSRTAMTAQLGQTKLRSQREEEREAVNSKCVPLG